MYYKELAAGLITNSAERKKVSGMPLTKAQSSPLATALSSILISNERLVALAEWLRRVPAKYMGISRESSNLSGDVIFGIETKKRNSQIRQELKCKASVALAEWLRRVPAKYMGFSRESSNLSGDVIFLY
ncbi:hypothetical protein V6N13_017383 [Hibiscus sabdariffa]|uniref:Uncharacterized protein n=1 Tax=Hibiscus sabdariffa TaxID=183260 RepID=A0ABR2CZT9_9ROSI